MKLYLQNVALESNEEVTLKVQDMKLSFFDFFMNASRVFMVQFGVENTSVVLKRESTTVAIQKIQAIAESSQKRISLLFLYCVNYLEEQLSNIDFNLLLQGPEGKGGQKGFSGKHSLEIKVCFLDFLINELLSNFRIACKNLVVVESSLKVQSMQVIKVNEFPSNEIDLCKVSNI